MRLSDYKFIIAVDLATYCTGYSVFDVEELKFVELGLIEIEKNSMTPQRDLFDKLSNLFRRVIEKLDENADSYFDGIKKRILVLKESMPMQFNGCTTIKTIKSLSKSHAILDLVCQKEYLIDEFDTDGIYPISVKSCFRTTTLTKPQKEDILAKVNKYYNEQVKDTNISDSMALVYALYKRCWNAKISKIIKELKDKTKTLKSKSTKEKIKDQIKELENNKI